MGRRRVGGHPGPPTLVALAGLVVLASFVWVGCAGRASDVSDALEPTRIDESVEWTECSDPRPEMCTREYAPVCAVRDTGVRCVTTPCDSTELRTASNGCTACSDPAVYRHRPGVCHD